MSDIEIQPVYFHPLTVQEHEIDEWDHANNVVYVQWLQDAATAHSAANGWTGDHYRTIQRAWVVRSHYIEYLRPTFVGEELTIRTWVGDMNRVSSARRFRILRAKDETLIAKAETLWAFIDTKTGRPCRIPEEVRNSFIPVDETA